MTERDTSHDDAPPRARPAAPRGDPARSLALAELTAGFPDARALEAFHRRHKLLLMAHSPGGQKALGRLVARAPSEFEVVVPEYRRLCGETLAGSATRGGHVNALHHAQGYLKRQVPAAEKAAFEALLESYRCGEVERSAVTAVLRGWVRRHGAPYLEEQSYLFAEDGA